MPERILLNADDYPGIPSIKNGNGPINDVRIHPADALIMRHLNTTQKRKVEKEGKGFVIALGGREDNHDRIEAMSVVRDAVERKGLEFFNSNSNDYAYVVGDVLTGIQALAESGQFSAEVIKALDKQLSNIKTPQWAAGM